MKMLRKTVKGWTKGAVWVARKFLMAIFQDMLIKQITTFPLNGTTSITSKEIDKVFTRN